MRAYARAYPRTRITCAHAHAHSHAPTSHARMRIHARCQEEARAHRRASTGNTRLHAPACARTRERSHELCRQDRTAARAQRTTYNNAHTDDLRQAHACASHIIREKRPAHRRAAQSLSTTYCVTSHLCSVGLHMVSRAVACAIEHSCRRYHRAAGPHGAHAQVHAALRCGGESAVGDGAPTDRPCGPIGCHSVRL